MKDYTAGTIVPGGLYVSARPCDVKAVSGREGLLEGDRGARYLRIPGIAIPFAALLALVLGGIYVVLFPIVGALMAVGCGVLRTWRSLRQVSAAHAEDLAGRRSGRAGGPMRPT